MWRCSLVFIVLIVKKQGGDPSPAQVLLPCSPPPPLVQPRLQISVLPEGKEQVWLPSASFLFLCLSVSHSIPPTHPRVSCEPLLGGEERGRLCHPLFPVIVLLGSHS